VHLLVLMCELYVNAHTLRTLKIVYTADKL
jgi:hypothetical protein